MKNTPLHCLTLTATLSLALTAAADMTISFDDGNNPFDAGTISTDQSVTGSSSLFVSGEELPTFNLPPELQNVHLTITMNVFDQGKWTTTDDNYGPRWGVGTSYTGSDYVAAAIIDKSFLPSDGGYGFHTTAQGDPFNGQFSDNVWFGPGFVSGSNRQGLSATSDDNSTGVGGWTEWTFDVTEDGIVTWGLVGGIPINDDIGVAAAAIFLFGGDTNEPSNLDGMYVDDIVIINNTVPEPSTYAILLGLAVLGLAVYRRRA